MAIHILYVISNSGTGGGQTHLIELLRRIDKTQFTLSLICDKSGQYVDTFTELAHYVYPIDFNKNILQLLIEINKLCKKINPDIIHNHLLRGCFAGSIVGIFRQIESINNIHGDISDDQNQSDIKKSFYSFFNSFLSYFGVKFVCVSEHNARKLRLTGVRSKNIHVIYNGVAEQQWVKHHEPTTSKVLNILSVARMHPAKGIDTIIGAARELDRSVHFHIVGDGPLYDHYQQIIKTEKLDDRITLHGFQYDVTDYLKQADVFVLSSNWEGLPIALIEAMSYELPIIATKVGGIPEIIHHNKGGYLFTPGDYPSLAFLIELLAKDEQKRIAFGKYNKQYFLDYLTVNQMIKNTESLYTKLLK